ncbi:MAG TPA: AMP-binding protein [Gemmatimonadaceae bacterium]|nr:AMP-binding protein [Gemmatimonadaceae bacterium]
MTDPFSLVPLAVASREGTVDEHPAVALVAAGITLLQRSAVLVRALAGRRAALLLPTGPQTITALAATEGRGAVLINPLASPFEAAYQLRDADVGAVLTIASLAGKLPPGTVHVLLDESPRSAVVVGPDGQRTVDLGSHVALDLVGDPDAEGSDEESAIVYTSAMEGRPLGAILTHRNLLANARATIAGAKLGPHDRALAALPWSHLFGLVVSGITPLLAGATVRTMSRFNPARALELLESDGITLFVGVPAMYVSMLAAMQRRGAPLRAPELRLCICGGAPLRPALQAEWLAATGIDLRQGYGLTEASPVVLFNALPAANPIGALGTPYPGVEVSLRDPRTFTPVADGVPGEICVRGMTVFRGYVARPGGPEPRGLEVRDGWLRTGDLATRAPDGNFIFAGLVKSMFTRNGFNIYPREIERAVAELPGVREARVTPIPDLARENEIALEVRGAAAEADVRAWCEQRLSAYKQPAVVRTAP